MVGSLRPNVEETAAGSAYRIWLRKLPRDVPRIGHLCPGQQAAAGAAGTAGTGGDAGAAGTAGTGGDGTGGDGGEAGTAGTAGSGVCTPGTDACQDDSIRLVCSDDGQTLTPVACTPLIPYCVDAGQCVQCTESAHCEPSSDCHVATCDAETGECSDSPKAESSVRECGAGGNWGFCDGSGECLACRSASDCTPSDSCHTATCDDGTCGNTPKDFGTECGNDSGVCDTFQQCVECPRADLGVVGTSTYRVLYDDDNSQLIVSIQAHDDKDGSGNPTASAGDQVYFGIGVNSTPTSGRLIRIRFPPAAPGTPDTPTDVASGNWATWQNADGASPSWSPEIGSNQPGWVLDPVLWKDNTAGGGNPDWAVEFTVDLAHPDIGLAKATGTQLRMTLGSRMHDEDTVTNVDQARPAGVSAITNTFIQDDMGTWLFTGQLGDACPQILP